MGTVEAGKCHGCGEPIPEYDGTQKFCDEDCWQSYEDMLEARTFREDREYRKRHGMDGLLD
jgi:hypothetical protein